MERDHGPEVRRDLQGRENSKRRVLQHEHSFGLEIRDWRHIAEHAHQLTEAAVKEAPPVLEVDVEQITGNKAATTPGRLSQNSGLQREQNQGREAHKLFAGTRPNGNKIS